MLFRLVRPMKRAGSRNHYYFKRIPADLKSRGEDLQTYVPIGEETISYLIPRDADMVRLSLRTSDPAEVKQRQAQVDGHFDKLWVALREREPVSLTHRQVTALAGELYEVWAEGDERESTIAVEQTSAGWKVTKQRSLNVEEWEAAHEYWVRFEDSHRAEKPEEYEKLRRKLEKALGPIIDRLLLAKGIRRVDEPSKEMLFVAFVKSMKDAMARRKQMADGDYSADKIVNRFPKWEFDKERAPVSSPMLSLTGLLEGWWTEAKAGGTKPSTYENHRNAMTALVKLLGHDDALRLTKDDVVNFKKHRLESVNPRTKKPISAKTVKDNDLAGLKTVLGWAKENGKIRENPAEGVTLKLGKQRKLRSKGFTDEEANAILRAALKVEKGNAQLTMVAAKRWVPWLAAYTGARVGELAQLRKEDIQFKDGHWVLHITPEAGTVKTNEARDVVLHAHLLEQGFVGFVKQAPEGHLFLKPNKNGDPLGPLNGVKNRLAESARKIVPDKNVAPNHGWRHRFKTVGMEAGIELRFLDAIQGQAPRTVAEGYGEVTIKTQATAIAKLPRYPLD